MLGLSCVLHCDLFNVAVVRIKQLALDELHFVNLIWGQLDEIALGTLQIQAPVVQTVTAVVYGQR